MADDDSVLGSGRLNDLAQADFNLPFIIKASLNFMPCCEEVITESVECLETVRREW